MKQFKLYLNEVVQKDSFILVKSTRGNEWLENGRYIINTKMLRTLGDIGNSDKVQLSFSIVSKPDYKPVDIYVGLDVHNIPYALIGKSSEGKWTEDLSHILSNTLVNIIKPDKFFTTHTVYVSIKQLEKTDRVSKEEVEAAANYLLSTIESISGEDRWKIEDASEYNIEGKKSFRILIGMSKGGFSFHYSYHSKIASFSVYMRESSRNVEVTAKKFSLYPNTPTNIVKQVIGKVRSEIKLSSVELIANLKRESARLADYVRTTGQYD